MGKSGAGDWQKYFNTKAYLNTFYGPDMFSKNDRFLQDYFSDIAKKLTSMMSNGKVSYLMIFLYLNLLQAQIFVVLHADLYNFITLHSIGNTW